MRRSRLVRRTPWVCLGFHGVARCPTRESEDVTACPAHRCKGLGHVRPNSWGVCERAAGESLLFPDNRLCPGFGLQGACFVQPFESHASMGLRFCDPWAMYGVPGGGAGSDRQGSYGACSRPLSESSLILVSEPSIVGIASWPGERLATTRIVQVGNGVRETPDADTNANENNVIRG